MQYSGYEHQFRLEMIKSALKAYENLREAERQGKRPLYRHKTWNTREREKERKAKKINWYKKGGNKSVMFTPYTPDSILQKMYIEEVKREELPIKLSKNLESHLKKLWEDLTAYRTHQREKDPVVQRELTMTSFAANVRK